MFKWQLHCQTARPPKKTPGLFAYLPSPAGPRSPSPWKQRKIPSWIGCPENRPESSGYSACCFLRSQMCQGRTLLHTFAPRTRQEINVEDMSLPLLYLTCQSGSLLFRILISLPVTFSWNNCHISLMPFDHVDLCS